MQSIKKYQYFIYKKNSIVLSLICVSFIGIFLRFFLIGWDPPRWLPETFMVDGGWWMNGARGKILFDDWFIEDYGMSTLMTPLYNYTIYYWFKCFGFGWLQASSFSCFCQLATIFIVGVIAKRDYKKNIYLPIILILAISPYYTQSGRVPTPETLQAPFLFSSIFFWFKKDRGYVNTFISSFFLILATAVKLNAIVYIFIPFFIALITSEVFEIRESVKKQRKYITFGIVTVFTFTIILFASLRLIGGEQFYDLLLSESGYSSSKWYSYLTFLSTKFVSIEYFKTGPLPYIWKRVLYSPLLFLCLYISMLLVLYKKKLCLKGRGYIGKKKLMFLIIFLLLSTILGHDRYIFFPIATLIIGGNINAIQIDNRSTSQLQTKCSFNIILNSLLLIFPLVIIFKPIMIRAIVNIFSNINLGEVPGLGMGAAGLIFSGICIFFVSLLIGIQIKTDLISLSFLNKYIVKGLLILSLLWEIGIWVGYYSEVESDLLAMQNKISAIIEDDSSLVGYHSATIAFTSEVHAVRRISPIDPPNTSAFELTINEIKPEYILSQKNYQWRDDFQEDFLVVLKEDYEMLTMLQIGPNVNNEDRFEYSVYKKIKKQ